VGAFGAVLLPQFTNVRRGLLDMDARRSRRTVLCFEGRALLGAAARLDGRRPPATSARPTGPRRGEFARQTLNRRRNAARDAILLGDGASTRPAGRDDALATRPAKASSFNKKADCGARLAWCAYRLPQTVSTRPERLAARGLMPEMKKPGLPCCGLARPHHDGCSRMPMPSRSRARL